MDPNLMDSMPAEGQSQGMQFTDEEV